MENEKSPYPDRETMRMHAMLYALTDGLQPLGEALAGAMQSGDEAAMIAALRKISKQMPEFLDAPELTRFLTAEMIQQLKSDEP